MSLLVEAIITLAKNKVDFVVIGGMAIRSHGSVVCNAGLGRLLFSRKNKFGKAGKGSGSP